MFMMLLPTTSCLHPPVIDIVLHVAVVDVQNGAQQEHPGERPGQQLGQHQHGPGAQCHHLPRMLQGVPAAPHHQTWQSC